jgi:cell division protein ZapE
MNVREYYEHALAERGYKPDEAQKKAIDRLQRYFDEWVKFKSMRSNALKKLLNRPDVPRGVYLWGGVGRGKSFLMDAPCPWCARRACTSTNSCAACTANSKK